jgi:hypothetical protein
VTEPAPTTTPAPVPAAVAKPADTSNFDARLKLATEMSKRPALVATEEPKGESDASTDVAEPDAAGADNEPEVEASAEVLPDADAATTDADATPEGTPEERLNALGEALSKYDLAAIKKALPGVKIPEKLEREFRALDRRQRKVTADAAKFTAERTKAAQELSQESQRVSNQQRQLIQQFKPAVDGKKAWEDQDYVGVAKALEKQFGTDIATITQKLATGKTGMTPAEKAENSAIAELRKELAELKASKADEGKKQTEAQKRTTAITKVGEVLKGHAYVTDAETLNEVFAEYEKTWDGEKFTKKPKQVADELQAKVLARAKKMGLALAPLAKTVAKPVAKTPPKRLPEPPRGGKVAEADDFAARLALAQRMTSKQRRGLTGE